MRTMKDYLFEIAPPWIFVGFGENMRRKWNPEFFFSKDGKNGCVRVLRGKKMQSVQDMMNEIGAAFQLFEGFGENWYALEECLCYLDEWLKADYYVVIIDNAEFMLRHESQDQKTAFLKTMNNVGEWWSKPILDNDIYNRNAIPFHVELYVTNQIDVDHIVEYASTIEVQMRTK